MGVMDEGMRVSGGVRKRGSRGKEGRSGWNAWRKGGSERARGRAGERAGYRRASRIRENKSK